MQFNKLFGLELNVIYESVEIDTESPYVIHEVKFPNKLFIRPAQIINIKCNSF